MGTQQYAYPFFTHTDCPHFPCHEDIEAAEFNCAFCYCPLYALGPHCGGNFRYNAKGIKDCTLCAAPHVGDAGPALVKAHFKELAALARQNAGTHSDQVQDCED